MFSDADDLGDVDGDVSDPSPDSLAAEMEKLGANRSFSRFFCFILRFWNQILT